MRIAEHSLLRTQHVFCLGERLFPAALVAERRAELVADAQHERMLRAERLRSGHELLAQQLDHGSRASLAAVQLG